MNFDYRYDYEALKLATNENDWMLYFKSIARHFVKAFFKNYKKLKWWEQIVKEDSLNPENQKIKNCLTNYYNLILALEPQENGEFNIKKEILHKFRKIKDPQSIQIAKEAYSSLNLYDYKILGDVFTLDQLMNLTLSFFHEEQVRIDFFKKIISAPNAAIEKMTLNQMLPQNRINVFQNVWAN